jgi:hypothetical protein
MLRSALIFFGVLAMLVLSGATASAATYYVAPAPAGSDANAGTQQAPFATLQKAADVAVAGDTVVVTPGTYAGAKFSHSGTATLPIVVSGMPGAVVATAGAQNANGDNIWIRDASFVTVEGLEVKNAPRAGIAVQGEPDEGEVHGVVIRGNNCHNNGRWGIFTAYAEGVRVEGNVASFSTAEHGIYVSNSADNPAIVANTSHDNFAAGIQINADPALDGDGVITNALVDSNVVYNNGVGGAAGINLASVRSSLVINNLLYENHASGIVGWDDDAGIAFGSRENRIFNNTVVQAVDGRFALSLTHGSAGNAVNNNILEHRGAKGSIEIDSTSEVALFSDFNVLVAPISVDDTFVGIDTWVARGHDAHSFTATLAELFVNPSSNDYRLPASSPAIDTGRPVTGVADDIVGVVRPQGSSYDIGAYEFTTATGETNHPPVANAGDDQRVDPGDTVTLGAAGSTDPDGDTLTFHWTQVAGPAVTLAGTTTVAPTFVAPEVDADTTLTFELTVADGRGGTATDRVSVVVVAPPPALKIFVTRPSGGERWKIGTKKKIRFLAESGVAGDVRVEVSRDGGVTFETIVASVPVTAKKAKWKVTGPATTNAIVRVSLVSDPRVFGVSPAPFTIR